LLLGQGEAAGAAGEAIRRRVRDQGRGGHRGRAQGEEAPHRGRRVGDPGGGVTLIRAEGALDKLDLEGDEATGAKIVRNALAEPTRRIASNAGYEGAVIVSQTRTEGDGRGFNAATGEWVDMVKSGIVDPTKVTRSALQNAASIAAIVLTAESAVVEKPEDDEAEAAGGHG